ncbi:MAG: hypothetical protein ACFFCS_11310 [Candidatus Hodarchaeota archaeon]
MNKDCNAMKLIDKLEKELDLEQRQARVNALSRDGNPVADVLVRDLITGFLRGGKKNITHGYFARRIRDIESDEKMTKQQGTNALAKVNADYNYLNDLLTGLAPGRAFASFLVSLHAALLKLDPEATDLEKSKPVNGHELGLIFKYCGKCDGNGVEKDFVMRLGAFLNGACRKLHEERPVELASVKKYCKDVVGGLEPGSLLERLLNEPTFTRQNPLIDPSVHARVLYRDDVDKHVNALAKRCDSLLVKLVEDGRTQNVHSFGKYTPEEMKELAVEFRSIVNEYNCIAMAANGKQSMEMASILLFAWYNHVTRDKLEGLKKFCVHEPVVTFGDYVVKDFVYTATIRLDTREGTTKGKERESKPGHTGFYKAFRNLERKARALHRALSAVRKNGDVIESHESRVEWYCERIEAGNGKNGDLAEYIPWHQHEIKKCKDSILPVLERKVARARKELSAARDAALRELQSLCGDEGLDPATILDRFKGHVLKRKENGYIASRFKTLIRALIWTGDRTRAPLHLLGRAIKYFDKHADTLVSLLKGDLGVLDIIPVVKRKKRDGLGSKLVELERYHRKRVNGVISEAWDRLAREGVTGDLFNAIKTKVPQNCDNFCNKLGLDQAVRDDEMTRLSRQIRYRAFHVIHTNLSRQVMLDHVLSKLKELWNDGENGRRLATKFMFQLSFPKAFQDLLKSDIKGKKTALGSNLDVSAFFLRNVLNQARNLLFKLITLGSTKMGSEPVEHNAFSCRKLKDPLLERFQLEGLGKVRLDTLYRLGNTQGRQRARLIREVKAIENLEKTAPANMQPRHHPRIPSGDITGIRDAIQTKWEEFLGMDDTTLFFLNETKPLFTGKIINMDLQDTAPAFNLEKQGGNYTSLSFHRKLKEVGLFIAGTSISIPESVQFKSNMFSPVPVPGSGCQAINGGSNTVVKEFEAKPPLIKVKGGGKVILHVPYTGKILVNRKLENGDVPRLASGSDIGVRNKEVKVILKPTNVGGSAGKKEVTNTHYINRSPLSYRSPIYESLDDFLGSFTREKHGGLYRLMEDLSLEEKEALHGFLRGDFADLDTLNLGTLFPVIESVLARNHDPAHSRVGGIIEEVTHSPRTSFMKSLACIFNNDGSKIGAVMKSRSIFMSVFHGIVVRFLQAYPYKDSNLYRRGKRLRRSVVGQISENFSALLAKNRKTMSTIDILQRSIIPASKIDTLYLSGNARKQNLARLLKKCNDVKRSMISASNAKIARRSRNVARCVSSISVNVSDELGVDVDFYEDLKFTSTFAVDSGGSCRGFDHSQIIGRAGELNEIRGRETIRVNASYSSKLSPLAFLDGIKESRKSRDDIPPAIRGYIVQRSHGRRGDQGQFCRAPGGNVTVAVHNGKRCRFNSDRGGAIVIGCRGLNRKPRERYDNSFVYKADEHP